MCVAMIRRGPRQADKREQGIALALVLILIALMITAVYTFSRRAIINVTISQNRSNAAEADALARGGLRFAEAIVYLVRLKEQAGDAAAGSDAAAALGAAAGLGAGDDPWERLEDYPVEFESGASLTLSVEEVGGKLNLNALVAQTPGDDSSNPSASDTDEAVEYLVLVLKHVIDGIEAPPEEKNYDVRAIAENLIDYMDEDDSAIGGRSEDDYYQRQDPPYRPRNGPFLSFDEVGLVEGIDPQLLRALRHYMTIHPIGARTGIDVNRAPPWVLPLIYSGPSGDRVLLPERDIRRILELREKGSLICTDSAADPDRCVSLSEAGMDEGSVYPPLALPTPVSVFRVVSEARVGQLSRRLEAIYDTRPSGGPQLLSYRRLRGAK